MGGLTIALLRPRSADPRKVVRHGAASEWDLISNNLGRTWRTVGYWSDAADSGIAHVASIIRSHAVPAESLSIRLDQGRLMPPIA